MTNPHESGAPSEDALQKINRLARRPLRAEEVYAFPVTLCDNEVDRDGERFSDAALAGLAKLFLGKTGLFDHSMRSADQCARVYDTAVETDPARTTRAGMPYKRLKAYAYMVRGEKNRDLIADIEAGIKKEVSVGCAMTKSVCSICGADARAGGCTHRRGETYNGKLCHTVLDDPADAYEWSFVAVPAQPAAGVTKTFAPAGQADGEPADALLTMLKSARDTVTLDRAQANRLLAHIGALEDEAADGRQYRLGLQKEVQKLCAVALPQLPPDALASMCRRLGAGELKSLKRALASRTDELLPPVPQLAPQAPQPSEHNEAFMI